MAVLDRGDPIFSPAASLGGRAAAFGKFLLFMVVVIALSAVAGFAAIALLHIPPREVRAHLTEPPVMLANEFGTALAALIGTVGLALAFREPVSLFGFGLNQTPGRRLRDLGLGLACGFGLLTLLLAGIAALGGFEFGRIEDSAAQAAKYVPLYALLFSLVAVTEEFTIRSFGLVQLSRAIGFWPAAILLSILFGAAHLGNAAETPVGLFAAGAIGFVFAYSFWRSGSLMWALGFHAAWDFAQNGIWGVPDSGITTPGALFEPKVHGAAWLTGMPTGPEASWLVVPVILIAFALAHVLLRRPRDGWRAG